MGIKSPSSVASIRIFEVTFCELLFVSKFTSQLSFLLLIFLTLELKIISRLSCFCAIEFKILFPTNGSNIILLTHPVFKFSKDP